MSVPVETAPDGPPAPALKRSLGLALLVFYGLGTIVGAGIYVLLGEVVGRAGVAAPVAFLAAGVLAGLTGLSYAELAARHPEAAGAAAYVQAAFGAPWLSRAVGFATIAVGVVTAATIARGAAGYIDEYVAVPQAAAAGFVVVVLTAVACLGVRESVGSAAAFTLIEIGGLLAVITLGLVVLANDPPDAAALAPSKADLWPGIPAGIFLAFFAFIGFETLANIAEEARDVRRTLPRAILISIGAAAVLYAAVSIVAVLAVPVDELADSPAPLCMIVERAGFRCDRTFSLLALAAIANGVLIDILMVSRLLYGMARRGWLPAPLAAVAGATRIPLRATLVAGAAVLLLAVLVDFGALVRLSSALILAVFVAVNLSLMRLHRRRPQSRLAFRAPRWSPPLAALTSAALIPAAFVT